MEDYCEDTTFEAECAEDEVILMQEAVYGRMQLGTCLITDYGKLGCFNDVLSEMDRWCSGQRTCRVDVRDLVELVKPCPQDLRSYLRARYSCLKVITPGKEKCCESNKHALVNDRTGYIASSVTKETECGSIDCPWLLEVPKGQLINISLYDFTLPFIERAVIGVDRAVHPSVCHVYAIIKERDVGATMTICAGNQRHKHVYTTLTNSVEIRIVTKKIRNEEAYFLLDFIAFGCPDIAAPVFGWVARKGPRSLIGCNGDRKALWEVTCSNDKWNGHIGNCTNAAANLKVGGLLDNIMSLTPDVSVIIIAIVAVTIAFAILLVGVVCLRRRWVNRNGGNLDKNGQVKLSLDARRESGYGPRGDNKNTSLYDGALVPREHNYFRTWELPGRQPRLPYTPHDAQQILDSRQPPEDDPYDQRYVEHIYESPTFARKDVVGSGGGGGGGGTGGSEGDSMRYYELDPDAEPFHPQSAAIRDPIQINSNPECLGPPQRCSYPGPPNSFVHGVFAPGSFTS